MATSGLTGRLAKSHLFLDDGGGVKKRGNYVRNVHGVFRLTGYGLAMIHAVWGYT